MEKRKSSQKTHQTPRVRKAFPRGGENRERKNHSPFLGKSPLERSFSSGEKKSDPECTDIRAPSEELNLNFFYLGPPVSLKETERPGSDSLSKKKKKSSEGVLSLKGRKKEDHREKRKIQTNGLTRYSLRRGGETYLKGEQEANCSRAKGGSTRGASLQKGGGVKPSEKVGKGRWYA